MVKKKLVVSKNGLPAVAFAIVSNPEAPETWRLPHHTGDVKKAVSGKVGMEETVDWERMSDCLQALSRAGYCQREIPASPEQILYAARHLAEHYRQAGKPLPDILAALV